MNISKNIIRNYLIRNVVYKLNNRIVEDNYNCDYAIKIIYINILLFHKKV